MHKKAPQEGKTVEGGGAMCGRFSLFAGTSGPRATRQPADGKKNRSRF